MENKTKKTVMAVATVALTVLSCFVVIGISEDSDATDEYGTVTVIVGGETQGSYNDMRTALETVNSLTPQDEEKGIVIECEAGKPIRFMQSHLNVTKSITINGNGAHVINGEHDFAIENGTRLDHNITLIINDLDNATVWGYRVSEYTFNLEMNNCTSYPETVSGMRIYITGGNGINNITLNDCNFYKNSSNCTVYSNANGTITLNNCTFDGINEPININSKSISVDVKVNVNDCKFTDCGIGRVDDPSTPSNEDDRTWAAPIRVINSTDVNGSSIISVNGCEFAYSDEKEPANGDILIGDGRPTGTSHDVQLNVKNTTADIQFQKIGYYTTDGYDGSKNDTLLQISSIGKDQILESSGWNVVITDASVDEPSVPDFGSDDDEDELPFIPGNNTPQNTSNNDNTTLVAAAAAVVVIMLAVVALMVTRNH